MTQTTRNERRVLGGAVICIRELKGMTQDALAVAAKINPGTLSRIERDERRASLAIIARLANALAVDIGAISYMATVYVVDAEAAA